MRVELRVVNSRFIATAGPVFSVEEAKAFIARVRTELADASHNVPVYLIGHGASPYADFQENLKNADWTAADDKRMKAKSSSWRTKEELAAAAEEDKYKSPWWAAPSNWVADRVGMAEGGTVPARRGGTFILAAEAGEDEDFVPASKRRAYAKRVLGSGAGRQAGGPVFDLRGSQFYGEPTPAIADRWANALGEAFMRRVTGNVAGVNVG